MAKKNNTPFLSGKLQRFILRINRGRGRAILGSKYQEVIVNLLVLLIPSQLSLHFWPEYSFVFGIRTDYFSPAIYLFDILFILIFLLNYKIVYLNWKKYVLIISLATINIFFSEIPQVSLYKWIKIIEYLSFGLILKELKFDIRKTLYISTIFYSLIGVCQFIIGKTTGIFYILGERNFDIYTPGIALTEMFGRNFLRAYSTFPHPNSLAGYLVLVLIYLKHSKFKFNYGIILILLCLLLTFSLSAFIGIFLYFIFDKYINNVYLFPLMFLSFIFPFIEYFKFWDAERFSLAANSIKVIKNHLFEGVGLGTFPKFSINRQPVHNLFLLTLSEIGLTLFLPLLLVIYKSFQKYKILFLVVVIGLFDHYFLTIPQNMLILSLVLSLW